MSSDKTILLEIKSLIDDFLANISETKNKLSVLNQYNNDIHNNHYSKDNIIHKILILFAEPGSTIQNLTNTLIEYRDIIDQQIVSSCHHEWISDEIDIDPDRSLTICYCNKCLMTKKY